MPDPNPPDPQPAPEPPPDPRGYPVASLPPQPPEPASDPAPPPAATVVVHGTKTERELSLERDLKAREQRMSELEDENRRLKMPPPSNPAKKARQKRSWLKGATFFNRGED